MPVWDFSQWKDILPSIKDTPPNKLFLTSTHQKWFKNIKKIILNKKNSKFLGIPNTPYIIMVIENF